MEGDVERCGFVAERLHDLCGIGCEAEGEGRELAEGCLFADADDDGLGGFEGRGYGQQQRSAAGEDDALAGDGQAAFDHRLDCADAHDVGQRPAGKGKEAFAGSGGDDQIFIVQMGGFALPLGAQDAGLGLIEDGPALKPRG